MANQGSGHAENREGYRSAKKFLTPYGSGFEKSPSLQKLPQQSSTETSGLGETLTSGFSSQESIRSTQSYTGERSACDVIVASDQCRSGRAPKVFSPRVTMKGESDKKPLIHTDQSTSDELRMGRSMQAPAGSAATDNFDKLFENPPTSQNTFRGLHVEDIDKNWDRRGSEKSHHSSRRESFRNKDHDPKFLGKNLESTWTKWSKERRASTERKLCPTEDEPPIERSTTPVKKALLESTQFVHPDLEKYHITEEDKHYIQRHRQQRYATYHVIEKSKKGKRHPHEPAEIILTEKQWTILSEFWEHRTFSRSRYVAMFLGFTTTILMIASICSNWIQYSFLAEGGNMTLAFSEGLFSNCSRTLFPEEERDPHFTCMTYNIVTSSRGWQNAVIGLMIFSASFGFIASILAVCGVCTSPLPKKIYYFHSSGEIFLVCAISTGAALIIYPVAMESNDSSSSHQYGPGYGLGWGSAFFFLAAAFCMSLDDLVRESAKAKICRLCFKSRQGDRREQSV
ncbi:uncharacterized protein LOC134244697 [Saccostrea cucullata]|uniref:uncharacterized protein LOC134244697 n=1 Tax=Saccostrea cuccullata TaxID=36930 RepID=UPI002ED6BDAB